jgi:hypothetical protein
MSSLDIINSFQDCVARIERGESLDAALAQHPRFAADLRPMLIASGVIERYGLPAAEVQAAQERIRPEIDRLIETVPARRLPPWLLPLIVIGGIGLGALLIWNGVGGSLVTPTATPTLTASATATATPTATPSSTVSPTVTASVTSSVTPTSTASPTATPTATQSATPSHTPTSTVSATHTATQPVSCNPLFVTEGVIESINGNVVVIHNLTIRVPDATGLIVGSYMRVEGCLCDDDDDDCETAVATQMVTATATPRSNNNPGGGPTPEGGSGGSGGGGDDDDDDNSNPGSGNPGGGGGGIPGGGGGDDDDEDGGDDDGGEVDD